MRRKSNELETVERIVAAARDEFTDHGYSGARVDSIAAKAGVNKALLYYHIGGKAALYERVLHDTLGRATENLADIVRSAPTPEEKLKTYIRTLLGTIRDNPQIPSIIMQELAGGARNLPDLVARDFARMFDLVTDILEEGARAGVFRETAPVLVHLMVVGPAIFHRKVSGLKHRFAELVDNYRLDRNFDISLETEIEKLVMQAVSASPDRNVRTAL